MILRKNTLVQSVKYSFNLKGCNLARKQILVKALSADKSRFRVKIPRKNTWTVAVFITLIWAANLTRNRTAFPDKIDQYYLSQLHGLSNRIGYLKILAGQNASAGQLRQAFYQSRLAYKKIALLTEYYNPLETFSLNSAAIERVEDDNPDIIIPPKGFQAVEQLLFEGSYGPEKKLLGTLLDNMLKVLTDLEKEPGRKDKFRKELVWDAVRSGCIRLMTLGITGFDSPVAKYSLPEARSTLASMKDLLIIIAGSENKSGQAAFRKLFSAIDQSNNYLGSHTGFDRFDRLAFIVNYLDPLYKQLHDTRVLTGVPPPEGRNPVNFNAASIFAADAFDVNFYSPPKEYWKTEKRVALGKKLFFDPVLSGTNNRSCGTCHQPEKAFTDGVKTPLALDNKTLLPRNTPTLWNSALQSKQFWDSRADILENQLDEVVHNEAEMRGSLKNAVIFLKQSPVYAPLFRQAYPDEPDPFTPFVVANSIASYIRSLVALNSRFDRYMRGDKTQLNADEKNGFNIFAGKGKCATCHFIPLFNGVAPPVFSETESEVIGVPETPDKTRALLDPDEGKYRFTNSPVHKYAFKTPTLRNIALTGPYMHNGIYTTLEEVVEFYNNGGGKGLKIAPPNQTLPFDKLNLSKKESAELVAFMRALTDTAYRDPGR